MNAKELCVQMPMENADAGAIGERKGERAMNENENEREAMSLREILFLRKMFCFEFWGFGGNGMRPLRVGDELVCDKAESTAGVMVDAFVYYALNARPLFIYTLHGVI